MILNTPKELAIPKLLRYRKLNTIKSFGQKLQALGLLALDDLKTLEDLRMWADYIEDKQWRAIA